jgi:exopolysaccharide production protein ExoY
MGDHRHRLTAWHASSRTHPLARESGWDLHGGAPIAAHRFVPAVRGPRGWNTMTPRLSWYYPSGGTAGDGWNDAAAIEGVRPTWRHAGGLDQPVGGRLKRGFDIVVASAAVVLLAPIMLIVATLIRVFIGSPTIFPQQRIGFRGVPFACYKFRTMVPNADEVLREHLARDAQAAAEWSKNRKLLNDPRVSGCLGTILRKSSLDELPQIFNVLRGEMSLVGPRPVVPTEIGCYGVYAREYLKARPGMTGIWQVSGRNRLDYSARVALDRFYVRKWSLALDVVLLAKTVRAIMDFDQTA